MKNPVLSIWEHNSKTKSSAKIIPDGCRDLLFWVMPGQQSRWTLTSLDEHPYNTQLEAGAYLKGYRLQPGVLINTQELINSVQSIDCDGQEIDQRINSFCTISPAISEAMACIGASDTKGINHAANILGVSMRTLQRLLKIPTGRTPAAWLSLSRARRVARILPNVKNLAQIAYNFGYADQAHMSREVKRWLGTSPSKIHLDNAIAQQLDQPGFY